MELFILFIGLILGATATLFIYGVIKSSSEREDEKLFRNFQTERSEANTKLREDYHKFLLSISSEYEQRKKDLEQQFNYKKQDIELQISKLDDKLKQEEQKYNKRLDEIREATIQYVDEESKKKALSLTEIEQYYSQQEYELKLNFESFKDNIAAQQKMLQSKLKQEEDKYNEVIEQFKRQEKIKQDKDFYRIVLKQSELEDVRKLKAIAAELHDPSILYKLIYKTYYERPFNEMVGRVVTERGDTGIYKITNLENGRVYIGQTRQAFKERWRTHVKRGLRAEPTTNNKLYAAMWEDGIENFTFEVLAECTAAELNQKEKDFIKLYHGDTWGYNSNSGVS